MTKLGMQLRIVTRGSAVPALIGGWKLGLKFFWPFLTIFGLLLDFLENSPYDCPYCFAQHRMYTIPESLQVLIRTQVEPSIIRKTSEIVSNIQLVFHPKYRAAAILTLFQVVFRSLQFKLFVLYQALNFHFLVLA